MFGRVRRDSIIPFISTTGLDVCLCDQNNHFQFHQIRDQVSITRRTKPPLGFVWTHVCWRLAFYMRVLIFQFRRRDTEPLLTAGTPKPSIIGMRASKSAMRQNNKNDRTTTLSPFWHFRVHGSST